MKRVLISGVCGLIGSSLADAMLKEGYRVTGVDDLSVGRTGNIVRARKDKNFRFVKMNISSAPQIMRKFTRERFDVIVHMAASKKIGEDGSGLKVLTNNVESTKALLELARKTKALFLFASTSDVYGRSRDLPFREDGTVVLGPSYVKRWSYAVSKLYAEHLTFAYYQEYKLPVIVVRYFGCFSERSNYGPSGGHVPLFIKTALTGGKITIHGDGWQTRSMTHVDDVVRGTIRAIKTPRAIGQIINIGTDEEISVRESARIIIDSVSLLSKKACKTTIRYVPMEHVFGAYKEIPRRVPDLTKAHALLGYKPRIDFRNAVTRVAREMVR